MKKLKVLIVEHTSHPCRGGIYQNLSNHGLFNIKTVDELSTSTSDFDVIILNSLHPDSYSLKQKDVVKYVESGGGLLCIHDTIFPSRGNDQVLDMTGIRHAYDAISVEHIEDGQRSTIYLATVDPENPLSRFPIKVVPENATHPVLNNIFDFEIGEEFWAINVAPSVKELLRAEVGDRIPAHPRFRTPIPVCGCRSFQDGRVCFFLLGHYAATYNNPNVLNIFTNAILWLGKRTSERRYEFDVFLSFSSRNLRKARKVHEIATNKNVRIFMSKRELKSGDVWDEKIRAALLNSQEVAILVTADSLESEWVATEWGASWALQKRITPILFNCKIDMLPDRLRRFEARKIDDIELYIDEVLSRCDR